MNINLTLVLQSIAMMIFVWFCMRFIWPPITQALEERRRRIAEGLAQSEEAEKALERAREEAETVVRDARSRAGEIIDQASQRGNELVEQAKQEAIAERDRQAAAAEADIRLAANKAREVLRERLAELAVVGAERVLQQELDGERHRAMLDKLAEEL